MNLILFESDEIARPLARDDRRAIHVLDVLRRQPGETFDVGLVNGPRGKATLQAIAPDALSLAFTWGPPPAPPDPIILIVGLPRPQTARDILRDATTLGVGAIHFVRTEKSDAGYAQSTLWSSGEWRRQLLAGAEQAFATRIPDITCGRALADVVDGLTPETVGLALDNYEGTSSFARRNALLGQPHALAIGGERGWSDAERTFFRDRRFELLHLGTRVLRTETAVGAGVSLLRASLGLI